MAGPSPTIPWSFNGDPRIFSSTSGRNDCWPRPRGGQKIAVEVKSFAGASIVTELERALGQFILYRDILEETEPERLLFLAITRKVYDDLFREPIGQLLLMRESLRLLVFNPDPGVIVQWIPE